MILRYLCEFRFLLFIYACAGLFAWMEIRNPGTGRGHQDVLFELYPEAPMFAYFDGVDSANRGDFAQAKADYERALASGTKYHEKLLYDYAANLVMLKAPPEAIDQAVKEWRWNFPHSTLRDPRIRAPTRPSR